MTKFSQRLSEIATSKGWTRADLATHLNTAWSTVDRWMSGSTPHQRTVDDVARRLNVSVQWLTGESDEPSPSACAEEHTASVLREEPDYLKEIDSPREAFDSLDTLFRNIELAGGPAIREMCDLGRCIVAKARLLSATAPGTTAASTGKGQL